MTLNTVSSVVAALAGVASVTAMAAASPSVWVGDAPGSWSDPARWQGGVPGGTGSGAYLGQGAGPRQIELTNDVELRDLTFDSDQPYVLTGPGQLKRTYAMSPGYPNPNVEKRTIEVLRGSHAIQTVVAGSGMIDVAIPQGSFLSVRKIEQGQYAIAGGGTVRVEQPSDPWSLDIGPDTTVTFVSDIPGQKPLDHLQGSIGPGATLNLRATGVVGAVTKVTRVIPVYGMGMPVYGTLRIEKPTNPNASALVLIASIYIAEEGRLDLGTGAIFAVDHSPVADPIYLREYLAAGNIYSSYTGSAGATGAETLAYVKREPNDPDDKLPQLKELTGRSEVDAVVYTYYGDTNVDGVVNDADWANFEMGFNSDGSLTGWYYGDFDLDGIINDADRELFDFGRSRQGRPLGLATTIPEPGMSLACVALTGLMVRRRRVPERGGSVKGR